MKSNANNGRCRLRCGATLVTLEGRFHGNQPDVARRVVCDLGEDCKSEPAFHTGLHDIRADRTQDNVRVSPACANASSTVRLATSDEVVVVIFTAAGTAFSGGAALREMRKARAFEDRGEYEHILTLERLVWEAAREDRMLINQCDS